MSEALAPRSPKEKQHRKKQSNSTVFIVLEVSKFREEAACPRWRTRCSPRLVLAAPQRQSLSLATSWKRSIRRPGQLSRSASS
mmetsp:Transcript_6968/g.16077  ORF Transcript_6968/g.16077 Transcript_6968/m.16077 type:complete len:83 (+) Transcript_6968:1842-2090(+)